MDRIDTAKQDVEAVEKIIPPLVYLPLPEALQHLNEDDISKLNKNLMRRLGCTLMPVVVLVFLLNILDRNNIANAKIAGLPDTLGISNSQYNTCLMIFYVGCKWTCHLYIGSLLMCYLSCRYTIAVQSHHSQSAALNLHMLRYFSMGHCVYVTSFHSELCWAVASRFILGLVEGMDSCLP